MSNLDDLKYQLKDKKGHLYFKAYKSILDLIEFGLNNFGFKEVNSLINPPSLHGYFETYKGGFKFKYIFSDYQHATHQSLALIDWLEKNLGSAFDLKLLTGLDSKSFLCFINVNGIDKKFLKVSIKKIKGKYLLLGSINFNYQDYTEILNSKNDKIALIQILLIPIQLNDISLKKYANKVYSLLEKNYRIFYADNNQGHTQKIKIAQELKIPYILSVGYKDIASEYINIISQNKYERIKLKDFKIKDRIKNNQLNRKEISFCSNKKCLEKIKLNQNLIKPFNQLLKSQKCIVCGQKAITKYIALEG